MRVLNSCLRHRIPPSERKTNHRYHIDIEIHFIIYLTATYELYIQPWVNEIHLQYLTLRLSREDEKEAL